MKKFISVLLVLVMVLALVPFAALAEETAEYETITGTIKYNSGHDEDTKDYPAPYTYSDEYFTGSAYTYRQDLGCATLIMAMAAGNKNELTDYSEGPENLKNYLTEIGFEDFETNRDYVERPERNTFGVGIANKEIVVDGEKYTVLAVGLRGCGYKAEWGGDLNVGESGDHAGFAICREKAMAFLQDYLARHTEIMGKIKIWCTGYSRGAVGANMLGGAIDDMLLAGEKLGANVTLAPEDLYVYCFEVPIGTTSDKVDNKIYKNIHNCVNADDLVEKVVPRCMGFERYGVDHYFPTAKNDENYAELKAEMLKAFETFENNGGKYYIDDFKYITVDPRATAENIINIVKGNKLSQGEFENKLIDILFTEVLGSRAEVYAAQDDLQELICVLLGTDDAQWDQVMKSLGDNAKANLGELMRNMIDPSREEMLTDMIFNFMLDAMRDAGISEYDAAQVRQMAGSVAKLGIKLVASYPDEIATLLYNITGIMSAHYGELCLAWMMTLPEDYMLNKQIAEETSPFIDVPTDYWCYDDIKYVYDNGLMLGKTDTVFDPEGLVTRGQVATVLYRMQGSPATWWMRCDLSDVKGVWCEDAVKWAYANGVVSGYSDGSFGADDPVTRQQLAAMLYRYANKFVKNNPAADGDHISDFSDAGSVSAYAVEAMNWAIANGILMGRTDGTLNPTGNASRAHFAAMIARFDRNIVQ